MSVSIKRSVVEQFSFNGKNVRSVYVKGEGECLVARDVYAAVGYDAENGKKAVQSLVPEKYKLRSGDVKTSSKSGEEFFPTQPNTVLLKEPGLYCLLARCKRPEAEPFMEISSNSSSITTLGFKVKYGLKIKRSCVDRRRYMT